MKTQPFRTNSCPLMLKPFSLLVVLVALLALASCARRASNESGLGQSEINVAAAANLSDAFAELGQEFTRRSGVRVVYSFGATADLAKQIENGAPFDLFAAADVEHLDALARAGLLMEGTQALYARGRLVLWIPPGSRLNLARLEDLSGASVERIAIAKPDVAPYGSAAIEALRALNIWSSIEPKVIYSQNVSQARQYAATGNADAAFIPRSLVPASQGRTIDVPATLHQPINQSVAVIKTSQKQQAARQFLDFLLSPEGQSLLERYGYEKAVTGEK